MRMLKAYSLQDPPPPSNKVKPCPIQVIRRFLFIAKHSDDPALVMEANIIVLGSSFCFARGSTLLPSQSPPLLFELKDVQLWMGRVRLDLATASDTQILAATFCSLTFEKKFAICGEALP